MGVLQTSEALVGEKAQCRPKGTGEFVYRGGRIKTTNQPEQSGEEKTR